MRFTNSMLLTIFLGLAVDGRASTSWCDANPLNLVQNCGFETGDFTAWTTSGFDVTQGQLGNLYGVEGTDPFDGISPNSGSFQAFFADLDPNATTISQTLNTTAGVTYEVSWYLAQDTLPDPTVTCGGTPCTNLLTVSFGGTTLTDVTGIPEQGYTLYSFTSEATSGSTVLSLTIGNSAGENLLDDVSVTATPEPSPVFLLGGGLLCFLLRKRADCEPSAVIGRSLKGSRVRQLAQPFLEKPPCGLQSSQAQGLFV